MHIDIIDDIETLRRHKDNWCSVYGADPEAQYFLSWTWMSTWLDAIDDQWMVLAAKPSAEAPYIAFFPIQLWSEVRAEVGFFNTIRMGGMMYAGFTGFLCDAAHEDAALPAFASTIKTLNWTSIHLERVLASNKRLSLFIDAFPENAFQARTLDAEPKEDGNDYTVFPYLDLPDDWETYLTTHLGSTTRKNARRCMRMLDSGALRVTHADADTFDRDLDTLLQFWTDKWAPTVSDIQLRQELGHHRAMLKACFNAGTVFLPVLWQDDKPIGARARIIDRKNKTLICLVGSRDLTIKRPPPGFVIHLYSIRWAIENGFKIYDFQIGNHSYKYDFGPKEKHVLNRLIVTNDNRNLRDRLDLRSLPIVFAMAQAYHAAGQLQLAQHGYRQILEVDQDHAGTRDILKRTEASATSQTAALDQARGLAQRGKTEEATRILDTILESEPRNFDAHHLLGLICLKQNQFEAAERHIRKAIAINARVAPAHFNHGLALRGLGRTAKSLKSFKKAIALRPDYPAAIKNRDQVARDMKRRT